MMELNITVDLSSVQKLLDKYPEVSATVQREKVTEAALLLERAIKLLTPEGAGPIHLRDTIFHKIEQRGVSVRGLISTPASYGESVELGTRPHFPPVAPILFWVEKKLGLEGKEAKSAAFGIVRAISKRGTKGAKMFKKGVKEHKAAVLSLLNQIPEEIIRRIAR